MSLCKNKTKTAPVLILFLLHPKLPLTGMLHRNIDLQRLIFKLVHNKVILYIFLFFLQRTQPQIFPSRENLEVKDDERKQEERAVFSYTTRTMGMSCYNTTALGNYHNPKLISIN
jgi:hypothetical protein